MPKDFSLNKYRALLEAIRENGFQVLPVRHFLAHRPAAPWIILRHDVDRQETRALEMAILERKMGIQATYYFRIGRPGPGQAEVIRNIETLGHEVGYHYEVFSKARGDTRKARQIFQEELATLRRLAKVQTAAMHGSPMSRWNNLAFWEESDPQDFALVGEAYLSFRHLPQIIYITDTGRGWNSKHNLRDRFPAGGPFMPGPFRTTDELIDLLRQKQWSRIYLLVHPNRWTCRWGAWVWQWGEDVCANWLKEKVSGSCYIRKGKDESITR